ncbi:MAG: hypothetical protein U5J63_05965 [Fodinibius sp.]|nr:hypothetical protein [Fodinibius sp.]
MSTDKKIKALINRALDAINAEIEAVREKPAQDVLFDGSRREDHPPNTYYYEFESKNTSLRFAEVISGEMEDYDEELELYPVEMDDEKVVLDFPHNFGANLPKVRIEWENDFVLRKLRTELEKVAQQRGQ